MGNNRSGAIGRIAENIVGKYLNMPRYGKMGYSTPDLRPDPDDPWGGRLIVEVKAGKSIPVKVKNAMQQVQQHVDDGQLGIVVLVPNGVGEVKAGEQAIVCLRMNDFIEWFGDVSTQEKEKIKNATIILRDDEGNEQVLAEI